MGGCAGKIKITLLLLFLGPLSIIMDACCRCGIMKYDIQTERMHISTGIDSTNHKFYPSQDSAKIQISKFAIYLIFNRKHVRMAYSIPFLPCATACSCHETMIYDENVEGLNIFTVNDYNSQYSAGDTINSLVTVDSKPYSVWNSDLSNTFDTANHYYLQLKIPPTEKTWQKFRFNFKVDGKEIEAESPTFWLY